MIEKLFKSSLPIYFNDCYLLVDKKPVHIKTAYLFIKHTSHTVGKIGDEWIADYIKNKIYINGYMYTNKDFGLFNEELDEKEITFIGNKDQSQYKLTGVSIKKSKYQIEEDSYNYNIIKFGALDYEVTHNIQFNINVESDSK